MGSLPILFAHSISPAVHNRAFQAKRMDAVYVPFLVQPAHLKDFMQLADKLPVCGFSVTIPHKQKILRYLDIIDPLARRIGAVNTVWKKAGKWRGINTDVSGVITPLSKRMKLAKSIGAAGRERRSGARRGLRADRCRREAIHHWAESRPGPRARQG